MLGWCPVLCHGQRLLRKQEEKTFLPHVCLHWGNSWDLTSLCPQRNRPGPNTTLPASKTPSTQRNAQPRIVGIRPPKFLPHTLLHTADSGIPSPWPSATQVLRVFLILSFSSRCPLGDTQQRALGASMGPRPGFPSLKLPNFTEVTRPKVSGL